MMNPSEINLSHPLVSTPMETHTSVAGSVVAVEFVVTVVQSPIAESEILNAIVRLDSVPMIDLERRYTVVIEIHQSMFNVEFSIDPSDVIALRTLTVSHR